jgi:hypothetical protein
MKRLLTLFLVLASSAYAGNSAISSPVVAAAPYFNAQNYGAVADAKNVSTAAITIGTNTVNIAPTTFSVDDIGKTFYIRRADAAVTTNTGLANKTLTGTIIGVSGTTATLSTNAVASVSGERMDWGTDNYDAFAAAVAAIPVATGGTLYIPAGNYLIPAHYFGWPIEWQTVNLRLRSNITVRGEGIGVTNLFYKSVPVSNNSWGGCCFVAGSSGTTYSNIAFYDMTIRDLNVAAAVATSNPSAINAYLVNNIRVERVEFINIKGNGALNYAGTRDGSQNPLHHDAYVIDCIFTGDSDGRWIEGDGMNIGNYYNVHVLRNRISGVLRQGFEGGGQCYNLWIDSNYVDMLSQGNSAINPTGCSKITVSNNKIYNATAGGIDFTTDLSTAGFKLQDIMVTGNHVQGRGYGLKIQNTSGGGTQGQIDRIIIDNNYFTGAGSAEIWLPYDQVPNITIANNWLGAGSGSAIAPINAKPPAIPSDVRVFVYNNRLDGTNRQLMSFDPGAVAFSNWSGQSNVLVENNVFGTQLIDYANAGNYGGAKLVSWTAAPGTLAAGGILTFPVATFYGVSVTDTLEIVRDTSLWDSNLIFYGGVTSVNTVQVYAYNPTASGIGYAQSPVYIIAHRR